MAKPAPDMTAARELTLWATNDGDLYRQRAVPIIKNLAAKRRRGTYDEQKAVKAWLYMANDAAQSYTKQFGGGSNSYGVFDLSTRWESAKMIAHHYEEQLSDAAR